jgi:cation transport ATPase
MLLSAFLFFVMASQYAAALTEDELAEAFRPVLCAFIETFWQVILPLSVLIIAIAGAMWIYSQDDAGKRNSAKTWVLHALVGLIIATIRAFAY